MLNQKFLIKRKFIPNKFWSIQPKIFLNQEHVQKIKLLIENEEEKTIDKKDYANIEKIDQKKNLGKKKLNLKKEHFLSNRKNDFSFIKSNYAHIFFLEEFEKDDEFIDIENLSETYSVNISDDDGDIFFNEI